MVVENLLLVVLVAGFPYRLLIKPEEGEVKAGRPDISVPTCRAPSQAGDRVADWKGGQKVAGTRTDTTKTPVSTRSLPGLHP